jgi:hypothetical protein
MLELQAGLLVIFTVVIVIASWAMVDDTFME